MNTSVTLCVGTEFQPITDVQCLITRIGGGSIIAVSFLSILFNFRYLYWLYFHRDNLSRSNFFLFSIIFSSFVVIFTIVPSVILQCLGCSRLCSIFYCQFEGFISYLNGCVHMFMLMMISIIRYNLVLHTNSTSSCFHRYSSILVVICWLFALIFAILPLLNWNKYIPEGLGFHCGLNWFDQSINSRLYLISAFLFVYIIPLIVLFIVNTYVYHVIHRLFHRASEPFASISTFLDDRHVSLLTSSHPSITRIHINQPTKTMHTTDPIQLRYILQLDRLRADRRFALATIFLVSEYLLSWTPYACVALLYLLNMRVIIEQPLFITICAFIAKISMIINPFIYLVTIKTTQWKILLFWIKCPCQNCRCRQAMR